tara:strand:- start:305 stop:1009 length:705 start_codon:yes stop_codon:yes gene_type:complete
MVNKNNLVSVIVPVFNEEKTISDVLKSLSDISIINQIVVVDDNSTDGTVEIIKQNFINDVFLIENNNNVGKGATIRQALKVVDSEFCCIQDADLELNPKYIIDYFNLINSMNLDVVFGSRFKNLKIDGYPLKLSFANKLYTFLINFLTNHNFQDVNCGHKFFKTEILKNLDFTENHFGADPEIAYIVAKKKLKHADFQIDFVARNKKQGKKITWIDGLKFFKVIYETHKKYRQI